MLPVVISKPKIKDKLRYYLITTIIHSNRRPLKSKKEQSSSLERLKKAKLWDKTIYKRQQQADLTQITLTKTKNLSLKPTTQETF